MKSNTNLNTYVKLQDNTKQWQTHNITQEVQQLILIQWLHSLLHKAAAEF